MTMQLHGFEASEESKELLQEADRLPVSQHPFIFTEGAHIWYRPNGRSLCWKCACKHLGAAASYASELPGYPHYFVRMIGELYHAHQEVPDRGLSILFRNAYTKALETGVAPCFDELIQAFYPKYKEYIRDWADSAD